MLEASSRNRYSLTIADAPGQGVVTLSRDGNAVAEFAFTVAEGERMELDRFGAESATVRVGGDPTFVASVFGAGGAPAPAWAMVHVLYTHIKCDPP